MAAQSNQLLSRFQGSLVGALVGDCLGAHFETFVPFPKEKAYSFFKEVRKSSTVDKLDKFTDDTAMARSVALSLIENKGFNGRDMANRFQSEYFNEPKRGYGGNVAEVFCQMRSLLESENPEKRNFFAPAEAQFNGSGSYGNGGAMRIAPSALFNYNEKREMSENLVCKITRLTHSHRHGIQGAILQHHAVHQALHLAHIAHDSPSKSPVTRKTKSTRDNEYYTNLAKSLDRNEFIDCLMERMKVMENEPFEQKYSDDDSSSPVRKRSKTEAPKTYTEKLELMKTMMNSDHAEVVSALGNGVAAFKSVPTAVYAFLRCADEVEGLDVRNPFERTVVYAVSLGGDTDTIASMAGAIAGAYYGRGAVPECWVKRCEAVSDAEQQATDLYHIVMGE